MGISWSLIWEVAIVVFVLLLVWKFVRGILKILLISFVIVGGVWAFGYVTSPDFSANKVVSDFEKMVKSVSDMSPAMISAAEDTLRVVQETGARTRIRENGAEFEGKNGLEGRIGLSSTGISLYVSAPVSEKSAVTSATKIASVFSGDLSVGEKIDALLSSGKDSRVKWGSGYIEVKDGRFTLVREKKAK